MIDLDDLDPVFEQRLRASLLARADLASGVTGPDPALFRTSAPRRVRRRNALLVAAAIALVIAGLAVLLRSPDGRRVDVVPATTVPTTAEDVAFVLDRWPAGFGAVESAGIDDEDLSNGVEDRRVLGRDGNAEVESLLQMAPLETSERVPTGTEDLEIGGRKAQWSDRRGLPTLSVEVRPGLTLTLASVRVDRDELVELVPAFDATDGAFDERRLPRGWSEIPDPMWSSAVIGVGSKGRRGWISASIIEDDRLVASLSAAWVSVPDADAVLEMVEGLRGGERLTIAGRPSLVLPDPGLTAPMVRLVMVLDDGHLAVVVGSDLSREEVSASAASMRPASEAEWADLIAGLADQAPGAAAGRVVDGVELYPSTKDVVTNGRQGAYRWVLTTEDFGAPGVEAGANGGYTVDVRSRDGTQSHGGTGWGFPNGGGMSTTRDGGLMVYMTVTSGDFTVDRLERDGQAIETVVVPVVDGSLQVVFGWEPAIDVGPQPSVVVTGTLADGTRIPPPFSTQPTPGSGMSFPESIGGN